MSTEQEVLIALKELLKKSGELPSLQAGVRSKIIDALRDRNSTERNLTPPSVSDEVWLVNELVREYLEWNGYLYTASVLASEADMPKQKKSRGQLCAEVGVRDDERSSALPLLANIVTAYTERIKRKLQRIKKE